jgi:hypothetical protein
MRSLLMRLLMKIQRLLLMVGRPLLLYKDTKR